MPKKDGRTITLLFTKERDTKNMVKFQEEPAPNEPPSIGSLYLSKVATGKAQKLRVTIEILN
jgi:hypothetical protein